MQRLKKKKKTLAKYCYFFPSLCFSLPPLLPFLCPSVSIYWELQRTGPAKAFLKL